MNIDELQKLVDEETAARAVEKRILGDADDSFIRRDLYEAYRTMLPKLIACAKALQYIYGDSEKWHGEDCPAGIDEEDQAYGEIKGECECGADMARQALKDLERS